jgi:hypothetical protein
MWKRTLSALAIAAVASVGVAQAQENVTLILKSGERLSAQLIDHGGVGFTVKVNNEERRIPTNDVAVIDFTGRNLTNDDWNKVTGGNHIAVLRSGQTVSGQFYDIGGTTPLRITMKTADGERDLQSSEVATIILGRTDAAVAATSGSGTTGSAPSAGGAVVVNGNQQWTSTGLTVRKGERLTFNTSGEVRLSSTGDDVAQPAGATSGRKVAGAPMPNQIAGALIGRIGTNGQPFGIGNLNSVVVPETGMLFLGINDDHVADNSGEFRVQITRSGGGIRR